MPMLDRTARWATNRLPKVISPGAHAVIDYVNAAAFLGMAGVFWRKNKRAAIAGMVCGAAELLNAMLTDYPGGAVRKISFETHGTIDFGMSGLVASLPGMFGFSDEPESRFFRLQGVTIAAVTGLTDFTGTGKPRQSEELDERAG